jgi:hypothetical protein
MSLDARSANVVVNLRTNSPKLIINSGATAHGLTFIQAQAVGKQIGYPADKADYSLSGVIWEHDLGAESSAIVVAALSDLFVKASLKWFPVW